MSKEELETLVKDLGICIKNDLYVECTYADEKVCVQTIMRNALKALTMLAEEKEALINDMQHKAVILLCYACKHYKGMEGDEYNTRIIHCAQLDDPEDFSGAIACSMFEWRGIQHGEERSTLQGP